MIALILHIAFLSALVALIVFFLRQKGSYFRSVQIFFVMGFLMFLILVLLDHTSRHLVKSEAIIFFTTPVSVSAVLTAVISISMAASILFEKPSKELSFKELCSKWFFSKKPNLPLIIYLGYVAFVFVVTWALTPWKVTLIRNIWGELIYIPKFEWWYDTSSLILFITFIAYPCSLLILASRKYKGKEVAKALRWLGYCWIVIACSFLIPYEAVEVSYSLAIIFLWIVAYFFKKTTILESLFEELCAATYTTRPKDLIERAEVFSKALGLIHGQVVGKNILFEFDPTSDYERIIEDFVDEALANAESVAVFTSKGSAIYSALSNRGDVKFLILTQRISTPRANTSKNEILLPANDSSLLLDALNKVLKAHPERNLSIVFDSLSSSILLVGFEKAYGFLRYALELLALENATSLFLFDPRAHDAKVASAFKNMFSDQITYGKEGLRVVKTPEPVLKA